MELFGLGTNLKSLLEHHQKSADNRIFQFFLIS